MTTHPTDLVLQGFAAGNLPEDRAVEVADHLDCCPLCTNKVLTMDLLTPVFASVPEPAVPPDLSREILARLDTPPEKSSVAWRSGLLLIFGGLSLLVLVGNPMGLAARSAAAISAILTGAGALLPAAPTIAPTMAALALLASLLTMAALRIMHREYT